MLVSMLLRARSISFSLGPLARNCSSSACMACSISSGWWPGRAVTSMVNTEVRAFELWFAPTSCAICLSYTRDLYRRLDLPPARICAAIDNSASSLA